MIQAGTPVDERGNWWDGMENADTISLREVTRENWRATLRLAVHPEQQRFVAGDDAPIAAIALVKAYVRAGGVSWAPYAIVAGEGEGEKMVGFVALAYAPGSADEYWVFHFFIDRRYQGRGYGAAALERLIELVRREQPRARMLRLVVHPENQAAQRLYMGAGFRATGAERWGEPVYQLALRGKE
jgi:diamine N-acetyltransferase